MRGDAARVVDTAVVRGYSWRRTEEAAGTAGRNSLHQTRLFYRTLVLKPHESPDPLEKIQGDAGQEDGS